MTFQFLLRVPGQLLPRRLPLDVLMIQSEHLYRLFIPVEINGINLIVLVYWPCCTFVDTVVVDFVPE